jgi:hypothetical protein
MLRTGESEAQMTRRLHATKALTVPRKRGRKLLAADLVDQVRKVYELTKTGNESESARICGISRSAVHKIVSGTSKPGDFELGLIDRVRQTFEATKKGSENETARICRVSSRSVRKIIAGTHGLASPNLGSKLAVGERSVAAQKCPTCNLPLVVLPCRRCKAKKGLTDLERLNELAAGRDAAPTRHGRGDAPGQRFLFEETQLVPVRPEFSADDPHNGREGFSLTPEHAQRFEEVRARRRRWKPISPGDLPF